MSLKIQLEVLNELGLHARPATEFVRCAQKFRSTRITIWREEAAFAATSILEILTANLDQGAVFTLEADGPEAEEALREFAALLVRFKEEEKPF
jgi:phosphocarrier protein HPr